jgi:hypothetical protein
LRWTQHCLVGAGHDAGHRYAPLIFITVSGGAFLRTSAERSAGRLAGQPPPEYLCMGVAMRIEQKHD